MDDTAASFGQWLRHRRRELDLTQEELARRVGCARITLRKIEADQLRPSRPMAQRLCEVLAVPGDQTAAIVQFARGRALDNAGRPCKARHNLPLQLTSFIGRQRETAEVQRLLADHRLVTLTGAGGVGKTRLALTVAAELPERFADGIWFVDLAPVTDGKLIAQVLLQTFGLAARPGLDPVRMLVDHLSDKSCLIVLDNCEHLVEASCTFAQALLQASTGVYILATSREPLNMAGEQTYRVPSLGLPPGNQLPGAIPFIQYEALQLFVERARLVNPDFTLISGTSAVVAEICSRLDGIPLAIELAAARTRSIPLEALASHLDDSIRMLVGGPRTDVPRHQTLRATINWSYDLLSEAEQSLLQQLSVFRGGHTLEAAEEMWAGIADGSSRAQDVLAALIDKSMLTLDVQGRYRMLETVRQYAGEKLIETCLAEAAHDHHLQYMRELAERAEPELRSHNQLVWLQRLDMELDNFRAALSWAQQRDANEFLRLASALWRFWDLRCASVEGMSWLNRALAKTEGTRTITRARALVYLASFFMNHMDVRAVQQVAEQAYTLALQLEDARSIAMALELLDYPAFYAENRPALLPAERALQLARQLKDHWLAAGDLWILGQHARFDNDLDSAYSLFDESLYEARLSGDRRKIAGALMELGNIRVAQGDGQSAERLLEEAWQIANEFGDKGNLMECRLYEASAALVREDYSEALRLADEAWQAARVSSLHTHTMLALIYSEMAEHAIGHEDKSLDYARAALVTARHVNDPILVATALCRLGDSLRWSGGSQVVAREYYAEALVRSREDNFKEGICHGLQGLGTLALLEHAPVRAVRLFAARAHIRQSVLVEDYFPVMVRERQELLAAARSQLGEQDFDTAWKAGEAMMQAEALTYAMEDKQ